MGGDKRAWSAELTHDKFVEFESIYDQARVRYEEILNRCLDDAGIKASMIRLRRKARMGVYKKQLDRNYEDPWTECADLIGARIVVALTSDKERVTSALRDSCPEIKVLEVQDKELERDPKHLKYGGLHIQVECPDYNGPSEHPIQCEVQVRTIAEHTWAETEHEYVYKGPKELPKTVQRTFARILALVELVDSELVRGVNDVQNLDTYGDLLLLRYVQSCAESFGIKSASESMTSNFIGDVLQTLDIDAEHLMSLTRAFVEAQPDSIHTLIETKGSGSPGFRVSSDFIAAQPELIPALALLADNPYDVRTKVDCTHLFEPFKRLAIWTNAREFLSD